MKRQHWSNSLVRPTVGEISEEEIGEEEIGEEEIGEREIGEDKIGAEERSAEAHPSARSNFFKAKSEVLQARARTTPSMHKSR